jgi:hypothetical protein
MALSSSEVKRMTKSLSLKRDSKTLYVPVDDHMYYNGQSYRVRFIIDGEKFTKNFRTRREAIRYRDSFYE